MKTHAVVVLNYKGKEDTLACVGSIYDDPCRPEIYVVDNGSGDDVLDVVRERWPDVRVISLPENRGFSGGMNAGIVAALRDDCKVITILNNDTIIPQGALRELGAMVTSQNALSPVVRYLDRPDSIWFGGGVLDRDKGLPRHQSAKEIAAERKRGELLYDTEILAGCCVTAKASVWQRVGFFDERYFLNFEDSDWSVRAGRQGVKLQVASHVSILHRVSASFKAEYSYLGYYYYVRNGLFFSLRRAPFPATFAARFCRHQVAPSLWRPWREGDSRLSRRRAWLLGQAFLAIVTWRLGRARPTVETRARRWVAQDFDATDESACA